MTDKINQFKKIDAHSHVGVFGGWAGCSITAKELIASMDAYRVEKAVISTFPPKESIEAADTWPDRFVGAVWVDPSRPGAVEEILDAVTHHGFRAVKLHPLSQAYLPNDPCVFPIADLAQKLDIPLMIHTGHPPFSLPWSVAQLAERYPQVKIVMIHMGHGNGMYVQAAIDMAKKYSNLYLETSGMPMHYKIKEAYETVGPDRIMWGLDAPFHHPAVEMQKVIVSGLTDRQICDVFYNNIKKLLHL